MREKFVKEKPVSVSRKNTSNWLKIRALTLTLAPLVIILGLGFCQTQKPGGMLKPEPSLTAALWPIRHFVLDRARTGAGSLASKNHAEFAATPLLRAGLKIGERCRLGQLLFVGLVAE